MSNTSDDDVSNAVTDDPTFHIHFTQDVPVEAVVALYEDGGWWKESPEAREVIPRMIRGSFAFAIARQVGTDQIIAMGRAISDGASDAYIQDVVVRKAWRGKGVGSALIESLVRRCTEAGISWIGLIGEPGTDSFYSRLNFFPLEGYVPRLHRIDSL